MIYVYRFVAVGDQNPALVGTEVSINVPLGTNIYKVDPPVLRRDVRLGLAAPRRSLHPHRWESRHLSHENGAKAIVDSHDGYLPGSLTVGQGHNTNSVTLSIEKAFDKGMKLSDELSSRSKERSPEPHLARAGR